MDVRAPSVGTMTTTDVRTGLIDVGTTQLYHEVRGSGPTLLLITGATGDAGEWERSAPTLAREFTVVTYDRRGFSRSPRPAGWTSTTVDEQADDAAALLRALGLAPAAVVGHSAGASIACSMVVRHPELMRCAVLYEPPLLAVVPHGDEIANDLGSALQAALASEGGRAAMELLIRLMGGDEAFEQWVAATDPAEVDRILANGGVFVPIELRAFGSFIPDTSAMRASGVPLTVALGEESRAGWFGAAAAWLVDRTGAELAELPGGHAGFDTHPSAFVGLVRRTSA